MPRSYSSRPSRRADIGGEQRPQLTVYARPVQIAPERVGENKLSQLADALSGLQPTLKRLANQEWDDEASEGGRMADDAGPNALMPDGLTRAQEFGWQRMAGARDALALRDQAISEYMEQDKETINLDEFLNKYKPAEGKTDAEYLKSFSTTFSKARDEIRAAHLKEQQERKLREASESAYSFIYETIRDINLNAADAPPAAKYAVLERIRTDIRLLAPHITNKQLDELVVQATEQEALEGRDGLLDALALRKEDGTPGLLDHPVYGEKLQRVRSVAAEVRRKASALQLEEAQFVTITDAKEQSARGTLTKAWLAKRVQGGILSGEKAAELWDSFTKVQTEKATVASAVDAINAGSLEALAVLNRQKGGKDAIENALVQLGEQAKGDPVRMQAFLEKAMRVNLMHPDHEYVLNGANPMNTSFKASAVVYQNLLQSNPAYVHRFVKDAQAAQFDAYWGGKRMGLGDDEALAVVQKVGDAQIMRESMARVRADFAKRDGLFSKTLKEFDNPVNGNEIVDRVRELTAYRVALGNTTNESAHKWATERVKQQYQLVDDYYVFNGGKPLNDREVASLKFYMTEKLADLSNRGVSEAEAGLRLYADESTLVHGDYIVQYVDSGRPVSRVNLDAIKALYSKLETEQMLKSAAAFQRARQARDEAGYPEHRDVP